MRKVLTGLILLLLVGIFCFSANAKDFPFVYHLSFDDGDGEEAEDESGNGNNGTLVNAEWTKDGKFGGAIEFPGGNSYVEIVVDVPEFDFTMAVWVKTDNGNGGIMSVLDAAEGGGGHDRHFFLVGGELNIRVWPGGAWPTKGKVADGEWHHLALVTETGTGQVAYVDGENVGEWEFDHSNFDWQKRVWIGFSNDAGNQYIEGILDEPMYIDAALTENEVNQLMNLPGFAVDAAGKLSATWGDIKTSY